MDDGTDQAKINGHASKTCRHFASFFPFRPLTSRLIKFKNLIKELKQLKNVSVSNFFWLLENSTLWSKANHFFSL